MANLINNNFEYTTKHQPEWFYQTLKSANSINKGWFRVMPDITKDTLVKKLVMTDDSVTKIDNRDCAWEATERFTTDTKLMSVKNFKINEEQCLDALDSVWSEMAFKGIEYGANQGANKTTLPGGGFEEAVMAMLQNAMGQDLEKLIWGTVEIAGVKDGFIDKALASGQTVKVAGVDIDSSNVLTEIAKVYNAIPERVLAEGEYDNERAEVRIFVGRKIFQYLKQALSTVSTSNLVILPSWTFEGNIKEGKIYYMGIEVVVADSIPAGYMFAASKDNLVVLTDLLSETQSLKVENGATLKDENMVYMKGKYRFGTGIIFEDEVVIYSK